MLTKRFGAACVVTNATVYFHSICIEQYEIHGCREHLSGLDLSIPDNSEANHGMEAKCKREMNMDHSCQLWLE